MSEQPQKAQRHGVQGGGYTNAYIQGPQTSEHSSISEESCAANDDEGLSKRRRSVISSQVRRFANNAVYSLCSRTGTYSMLHEAGAAAHAAQHVDDDDVAVAVAVA